MKLGDGIDTAPLIGTAFQCFDSAITCFDLYYIFNHRKFSYPAAFNQSTQQKKTSGSPIIGFGFTRHRLNIDWDGLALLFNDKLGADVSDIIESSLEFDKITFTDLSLSGGYACNYVFAENWLLGASLSVGLSYKQSISDTTKGFDVFGSSISNLKDFRFSDLTFNFMGRFGIVYNNGKWFAGISSTIHSYNYSNTNFYTNNSFGYINGYIGFNFGRKKQH